MIAVPAKKKLIPLGKPKGVIIRAFVVPKLAMPTSKEKCYDFADDHYNPLPIDIPDETHVISEILGGVPIL